MKRTSFRSGLLLLCCVVAVQAQTANQSRLWYAQPANGWLEALPLGNGTLGAMVFGGVPDERIQFNEDSLWLGSEQEMGSYQPFGDVLVHWNQEATSGYRRELNLTTGVQKIAYTSGSTHFTREAFASYPDGVLVYRFDADRVASYSGEIRLTDRHGGEIHATRNWIVSRGALSNGLSYEARLQVICEGGQAQAVGERIIITNATRVTLILAAATSFVNDPHQGWRGRDAHRVVVGRVEAARRRSYASLRARHVGDFSRIISRVQLSLGPSRDDLPTDERIVANARTPEPALDALMFQYSRYLLLSSSRAGGLPANLQGLWNDDAKPAWYSGYTTDINLEMNYWLAEPTALGESLPPLFAHLRNVATVTKRSDDPRLRSTHGWINYSTWNPMGGSSRWGMHRPGSAWLMRHLWEHYEFTRDEGFLREQALPAMKDVAAYWEDQLTLSEDGRLVSPAGWSPEHGPTDPLNAAASTEGDRTEHAGVSYDQEIVWDLLNNTALGLRAGKAPASEIAHMEEMRDHLLWPRVGRWGQLQEWQADVDSPTDQHRHLSHLFALYPGHQIDLERTPDLSRAARVSLMARGDGGPGWSQAWKICLWARLADAEHAYRELNGMLRPVPTSRTEMSSHGGGVYPNLFNSGPPFQIDGNLGFGAGIAEMLLQSQNSKMNEPVLRLLPALPKEWRTGTVRGLRARGGFVVAMVWHAGTLTKVRITATHNGGFWVRRQRELVHVNLRRGQSWYWAQAGDRS